MLKIYEGNKTIESHRPIIIVTATIDGRFFIGEHFIFTGWRECPFLAKRMVLSDETGGRDVAGIREAFSEEAICTRQLQFGRDDLDAKLFELNRTLHTEVFIQGFPFGWNETTDTPLMRFAMRDMYARELHNWVEQSRAIEMDDIRRRYQVFRRLRIEETDIPFNE